MEKKLMTFHINGDTVYFTTDHETYSSKIVHGDFTGWYLRGSIFNHKNQFFINAGIEDVKQFQLEILGYSFDTYCFPSCHTREDVIKLVEALVDYNNRHVGDRFDCPLANRIELRKRLPIKINFNL